MHLDPKAVRAADLERLRPYIRDDQFFYRQPGDEHYRLLAYLSTTVKGDIFDIGTHRGDSAMALSLNEENYVHSFDVISAVPPVRKMRQNVSFHQENLFEPIAREKWRDQLLSSEICFIDIDPHEGAREFELVSWLESNRYQGLIVLDDIWYFDGMRKNLWSKIPGRHKIDVTDLGHWSGTGLVRFANEAPITEKSDDNWTIVTGYFDLTERDDANDAIRSRPSDHYIEEHASGTLSLDRNLVIFCHPRDADRIRKMRPEHLRAKKTHIVQTEFDEFPISRYYEELKKTRVGGGHCARDPRNTASYYLFCMARFAMMKSAITSNVFGSELFAWSNICIERMGFRNLVMFERALNAQRTKFSTAYINYIPKNILSDLSLFFGRDGCRDPNGPCGRCSMCSGFFTGSAKYMWKVATLVEEKFAQCLRQGYGHADEQLIALVHHDDPDLFDWYPADYAQMVTNYAGVRENAESSIHNLVRPSFEASDWRVCLKAAKDIWRAYLDGKCQLSDVDLSFLIAVLMVKATGPS